MSTEHVIRHGLSRYYYWTLLERDGSTADLITNTPTATLYLRLRQPDGTSDANATPVTRTLTTGVGAGIVRYLTSDSTITGTPPNPVVTISDWADLIRDSRWDMWIVVSPAPNGSTGVYPDCDYDTLRVTT